MSETLDKLKSLFESNIALAMDDDKPFDETKLADPAEIEALFEKLTPEETEAFEIYRDALTASQFDKAMSDFSPELKAMTELFISDCVADETGGEGSTTAAKEAAVAAVPDSETPYLRARSAIVKLLVLSSTRAFVSSAPLTLTNNTNMG
jgi:hypothetical protein